jgi:hypothetical protein
VMVIIPSSYYVVRKRKQQKLKKKAKLAIHQSGMEPCACRVRFVAQRTFFVSRNYGSSGSIIEVLDMTHSSV